MNHMPISTVSRTFLRRGLIIHVLLLSWGVLQESIGGLLFPLLTDFSRPGFPMSFDEDDGFLRCEPPGLAWQISQPHQLEFTEPCKTAEDESQ